MTTNTALWLQAAALVFQISAFAIIFLQLRASQRTLMLTAVVQRRELYINLTHSLPDETVSAMMLHVFDHFDIDTYRKDYQGNEARIRSYLLMKRKYFYLVLATSISSQKNDPIKIDPMQWIGELCRYKEFRDVHQSHKRYYPIFQQLVDPIMARTRESGWALSAVADEPARQA